MTATLAVLGALFVACVPDLSVPPGADIQCSFDVDCPDGQLCQPALERCVDQAALDIAPAGFVGLPVVSPSAGGASTSFSLAFEVNEELVADPLVVLDRGDRFAALGSVEAETDRAAGRYAYAYESDGAETAGARPVEITLLDLQGNASTISDAASFVFDFEAPTLAGPPRLSAVAIDVGDEVVIDFVMSEAVPTAPVVEMTGPDGPDDTIAWEQAPSDDAFPLFFRFTFTRDASLALGDYDVTVRAVDTAGNEMNVSAGVITVE